MTALGLDAWWNEPHYRQSFTPNLRGEFILGRLLQRDPLTLRAVMTSLFGDAERLSENITAAEWTIIMTAMGASPDEIAEVRARMREAD